MGREEIHRFLDLALDLGQRLVERPGSPEARQHFQNAKREALLGVRAVVDASIRSLDEEPAAPTAGPASIKIE
jgi:hypothetical protein